MKPNFQKILRELKPYRERKASIDPARAALLGIDLQHYFLRIVDPILENILRVIQVCRERHIPILFTQHGHSDPSANGGLLEKWWGELIIDGTKDWQFLPQIKIEPNDRVLPKKRYSAFLNTDLDAILRSKNVQDLIICGVMTNLCCESTARDGFMRDYRIFFLIDGTATGREDLHLASLKNLGYGFAYLVTCQELTRMLKLNV
jgi:isochorismate hydrolase